MNKKVSAFLTERGMTVEGNYAYGTMNGFETNAVYAPLDNVAPFRLHFSCYLPEEGKRAVEAELRTRKIKFLRFQFSAYGLMIGLNGWTANAMLKTLPERLDTVFGILTANGAVGGVCPVCGKEFDEETKKVCSIDGCKIILDGDCVEQINGTIVAENRAFEEAPNNYLFGFFGALIGGVAGGVLSALLLAYVGTVAAISSVLAAVLGTFLYQKFHGKPNKMMILIVALTTLVCMALSVVVLYIIESGIAAQEEGLDISAFEAFKILMQAPALEDGEKFSSYFYTDLAMTLVFSAIGVGVVIFDLFRKIKRQSTIK